MSPTAIDGSASTARSTECSRPPNRATVSASNRSAAKVKWPSIPAASGCSTTMRCRSNCEIPASISTCSTRRSGSWNEVGARFSNENPTWISGCHDVDRTGSSTSTRRSNGTSACANARRSRSRVAASSVSKPDAGSTSLRNTMVLTNIPINSSRARSPRPATGLPIAMSVVPDSRASSTANALCSSMNSDTSCARASSDSAAWVAASIMNGTRPPRCDCTAGRGRSAGN